MFCGKCGSQLQDDARFCASCGNQINQGVATMNLQPSKKAVNFKKVLPISIVAIALVIVIVIVNSVGGGGYKKAIDNCMAVYFDGDFSKVEALAPPEFWGYVESDDGFNGGLQHLIDGWYNFENMESAYEEKYGSNFTAKYKITDKEKMDSDTLDEYKNDLNRRYDISEITIKEGYELLIDFTYSGSRDAETRTEDLVALKIDGDWYLCDEDGSFILMYYNFALATFYDYWE